MLHQAHERFLVEWFQLRHISVGGARLRARIERAVQGGLIGHSKRAWAAADFLWLRLLIILLARDLGAGERKRRLELVLRLGKSAGTAHAVRLPLRRRLSLVHFLIYLLNLGVVLSARRQLSILEHRRLVQLRKVEIDFCAVCICLVHCLRFFHRCIATCNRFEILWSLLLGEVRLLQDGALFGLLLVSPSRERWFLRSWRVARTESGLLEDR